MCLLSGQFVRGKFGPGSDIGEFEAYSWMLLHHKKHDRCCEMQGKGCDCFQVDAALPVLGSDERTWIMQAAEMHFWRMRSSERRRLRPRLEAVLRQHNEHSRLIR